MPDLPRARKEWGWLLGELGYDQLQDWEHGRSWRLGGTYLVIEQLQAMTAGDHDRLRPGMNHLAFCAGSQASVNALTTLRVGVSSGTGDRSASCIRRR